MTKILPCKECGKIPSILTPTFMSPNYSIACSDADACISWHKVNVLYGPDRDRVITAWNEQQEKP